MRAGQLVPRNSVAPDECARAQRQLSRLNDNLGAASVTDADMVQQICVKDFQTFPGRFYPEVSALLTVYIQMWHQHSNPVLKVPRALLHAIGRQSQQTRCTNTMQSLCIPTMSVCEESCMHRQRL